MDSSMGAGLMVVFAVSGSVALLALHVHKRLLSDFMKKIEFEMGLTEKNQAKKTVSFAVDVMEPSSNNKEYRKKHMRKPATSVDSVHHPHYNLSSSNTMAMPMPLNRQVLYKGLIQYRTLKGCDVSN